MTPYPKDTVCRNCSPFLSSLLFFLLINMTPENVIKSLTRRQQRHHDGLCTQVQAPGKHAIFKTSSDQPVHVNILLVIMKWIGANLMLSCLHISYHPCVCVNVNEFECLTFALSE